MAGCVVEDHGTGGSSLCIEGMSNELRCHSSDSLTEWRSCEQVEDDMPSTSPPYWDTDDDDGGPRPADLYGKFTWKIENFSQTTKRELKSNAFEVGGYKWYILIYPQGCDVSNHLSLFLCVFNHEKLHPGWSHFAQFTIAVVNKDPKKSKYSDTLHRFWKKEHDWGWKKFMELSKVSEGFVNADTLVIKAQVQVLREKAHRPFCCLDRHYRRELVRVYLSNVEQICRRFVEERRDKLGKLIADKMLWASFRAFWLGIDQVAKRRMSRDKTDTILKLAVKHFFIEKEVTSTLVMDSLYSGLKALEGQSKNKNGAAKLVETDEFAVPMVFVERDMFVLADDVLLLLERAALEFLPQQPSTPKDENVSQNRTKDGSSGEELMKDSIERDERRLTELGRRTVEIFVLAHIFSTIEVAYQEDVALKRQEELIREEEAGQFQNEPKAKRCVSDKEKRTKKKQTKQRRNSRKGKDRGRDEKSDVMTQDKHHPEGASGRRLLDELSSRHAPHVHEKIDNYEDDSDMSDAGDNIHVALRPEIDDRDSSSINWDTDNSEIHPSVEAGSENQNGHTEKRTPSIIDDSCSTCSTDSVPSVVTNGPYKGNSLPYNKRQTSPSRVKGHGYRDTHDRTGVTLGENNPSYSSTDACEDTDNIRHPRRDPESVICIKDRIQSLQREMVEKEEEAVTVLTKLDRKDNGESRKAELSSSPFSLVKKAHVGSQQPTIVATTGIVNSKEAPSNPAKPEKSVTLSEVLSKPAKPEKSVTLAEVLSKPAKPEKSVNLAIESVKVSDISKSNAQKLATSSKATATATATHPVPELSRPLSAPLIPSARPAAPVVSTVKTAPLLSRSFSAVGRLGTSPSPFAPSYVPQSYRNAIVGTASETHAVCFNPTDSSSQAAALSQPAPVAVPSASSLPLQPSARNGPTSLRHGLTFGSISAEAMHSQPLWRDDHQSQQEASTSDDLRGFSLESGVRRTDINGKLRAKQYSDDVSSCASSAQAQGLLDEFPHIAIINDLLDEDQGVGKLVNGSRHSFNRQYIASGEGALFGGNRAEQCYGEGFQGVYGSSNDPVYVPRDVHLSRVGQIQHPIYNNGQWPYHRADMSMFSVDANGYSYQLQEYLNTSGADSNMYRSTNRL